MKLKTATCLTFFTVASAAFGVSFAKATPSSSNNNNASAFIISPTGSLSSTPTTFTTTTTTSSVLYNSSTMTIDKDYPGTAVERMLAVRSRVKDLSGTNDLNGKWVDVRRKILWAGGLRDLPNAIPGQGYTGHSFNDYNHVDLTCMLGEVSDNKNEGDIAGIAIGNFLGDGIRKASLPDLGIGGSWSTCANGCNVDPPQDVAHIQFKSRIAFKLVWVPNELYDTFVLIDDDGNLLASGKPSDGPTSLPSLQQRQMNYRLVKGSKYATEANKLAQLA